MISYHLLGRSNAMYEHGEYFPPLERARELCCALSIPISVEKIPIEHAFGRILAEDIISKVDDPPFDNSSMDGYAVCHADTLGATPQNPIELQMVGTVPTGRMSDVRVGPGQAAAIMTGGPMPEGADAIVVVEDTTSVDGRVRLVAPGKPHFIRRRGENLRSGQTVMAVGTCMTPSEVGLCATTGHSEIPVISRLKVAVIPTGDELIPPGETLEYGQIHESNSYGLASLIEQLGHTPIRYPVVDDEVEGLRDTLDAAARSADLIITSGGVSMGEMDMVRKLMEEEGEIVFWRVRIRPGSPPLFGTWKETPVFGLPGNPVSSHVVFRMLVKPWMLHVTGVTGPVERTVKVKLLERVRGAGDCLTLRRIRIEHTDEGLMASQPTHQGSGNLLSLTAANGLTLLPPGCNGEEGDIIDAILF